MSFEEKILGRWKWDRSENIDEYLKATNVNLMLRQVAKLLKVTLEVSKEGDVWTFHYLSTFKNVKLVFKLGEPFEEKTVDGRVMMSVYYMEGDKMVCDQTPIKEGDIASKFIVEISDDDILSQHCISVPQDVKGVRFFNRDQSSKE